MKLLPCLTSLLLATVHLARAADDYKLGPDSMPREGVPAGRVEGPILFKSQVFTNTLREHWIFVPAESLPNQT